MPASDYNTLIQPDLRLMLAENDAIGLSAFGDAFHPAVVAEILVGLSPADIWRVLSHSVPSVQAEILSYFSLADQMQLVEAIDRPRLSKLIEEMPPDDRVDLLERMDPEHVEALLPLIAQAERSDIRKLLSYPEESAGAIMTTEYVSLPADITVAEALNRLRTQAPSRETIYYVYVTDEARRLIGFLSLRYLITARPSARLADIMERDVISVHVDDDQEFVAREINKYGFIAIPVVDHEERLVGIVTYDDAADVLLEEATEDAQLLAAVQPLEDGYFETPLLTLARKRGVWLVILLGTSFFTAWVISMFEPGQDNNWMMMFLPLVLASGGNPGNQSATLVIRALAIDEKRGSFVQIARKEACVGLLLGTTLAGLAFVAARILLHESQKAGVVSLTVFLAVLLGTVLGAMLPLFFKRVVHVDPALMSNPLIASLADVMGVFLYYNIARALLGVAV